MSVRLANINLSTVAAGTNIDTNNVQLAQCSWIEFLNESPYTVELQLGGLNIPIPAWYDYPVQLQSLQNGYWTPVGSVAFPPQITPQLLVTGGAASTQLLTTLYLTGETPATTIPQPLVRQTYIPNTITTQGDGGTAVTLTNSNFAPGTNVITVTPSDSALPTFTLDNEGNLILKSNNSGTLTTLMNIVAGAAPRVAIGAAGVPTTIDFIVGSLSRVAISGPFTVATTGTSCAHGLGAVPDFVVPINDAGSAQTNSFSVNFGTMTNFDVTVYATQNNTRTRLLAIKM